jgi:fumarate hydratase subunit beta
VLAIKRLTVEELKNSASSLKVGEKILLSGVVFTARDAAHKRISDDIKNGKECVLPEGAVIYYAGPSEAPKGLAVGACGPTTSSRMDSFSPKMIEKGFKIMIGKGNRSEEVVKAIKNFSGLYLLAVGGAGAVAAEHITSMEVYAYSDLGTESIKKLELRDFPLFVGITPSGENIFRKN